MLHRIKKNADIKNDVEKRFDISSYEVDWPHPLSKNKKVLGMMNDEMGGVIRKKFIGLKL